MSTDHRRIEDRRAHELCDHSWETRRQVSARSLHTDEYTVDVCTVCGTWRTDFVPHTASDVFRPSEEDGRRLRKTSGIRYYADGQLLSQA